ncbi:MAG TPA: hypothetical protein VF516_41850 [Kofleriaceae bacterium]
MAKLEKAQLRELDETLENEVGSTPVTVQFNPDTLKVSYANQVKQPEGAGDQRGGASQLFVGAGTTKMTCQLWFDVTAPNGDNQPSEDDVRKLTTKVSFFITPKEDQGKKGFVPPGVRFLWGSFQFDGIMESVEESLEYFSPDGKPLRASVSIALSQQKILVFPPIPANGKPTPGSTLARPVPSGKSVQQVAGKNWQSTAARNGIENPRRPPPGQRLR